MVEGNRVGEPVHRAKELMLRDVLRFTKPHLESIKDVDYRVVELRLDSLGNGYTVVEPMDFEEFRYTITDEQLVELGAELVYARMG